MPLSLTVLRNDERGEIRGHWVNDEDRAHHIQITAYSIEIHVGSDVIHVSGLENRSRFIAALKLTLAALEK